MAGIQSVSNTKLTSIITNKELDNLFIKNNFYKESNGSYNKYLSLKDSFSLIKKTGKHANNMANILTKPFTKDQQDAFKGFLSFGKTKDFIVKNFIGFFAMFSILNHNAPKYNSAESICSDYKDYSELFRNIIANPPKNGATFDAFRRYKGVDCGKINCRLRGLYNLRDKKVDKEIKNLKKYIDTQVVKDPITLYRGEGLDVLNEIKMQNGTTVNLANMLNEATKNPEKTKKVNEFLLDNDVVATQPSFMSTSMNPLYAKDFGGGNIFWELKTAPNTKACFIEPLQVGTGLYEDEILLQAGSKIRIKEAKFDENFGSWILKGEVFN